MEYTSVFDIIGPIMVGPSSSHTAGALAIARYARDQFQASPKYVEITLYESFAKTHKGHGTDVALVSGILGFDADDLRIPNALELAKNEGLDVKFIISNQPSKHPNTAKLILSDGNTSVEVIGVSIGGGSYKITYEGDVRDV